MNDLNTPVSKEECNTAMDQTDRLLQFADELTELSKKHGVIISVSDVEVSIDGEEERSTASGYVATVKYQRVDVDGKVDVVLTEDSILLWVDSYDPLDEV